MTPRGGGNVATATDLSVSELILAYVRHAEVYNVKHGVQTGEVSNIKLALRPVRRMYGETDAWAFGRLAVKAVRVSMVEGGLCRNKVNKWVRPLVRLFKWAVANEMVPATTHQGLKAVAGLRRGRCEVRESDPVRPVCEAFVEAIRDRVSRQVWARVRLQLLTRMKPGEVCILRGYHVDMTGDVRIYWPSSHKTEHLGRDRVVHMGPKAQEILRPWLSTDQTAFVFSPRDARAERVRARSAT